MTHPLLEQARPRQRGYRMTDIQQASLVGALRRTGPEEADLDERELNRLVEKRAKGKTPKETANALAQRDKAAQAMYAAEKREANRHAWITHYRRQAAAHAAIAERFESKAQGLQEEA